MLHWVAFKAFILDILDGLIEKIANSFIFSDFSFLIRILDDKQTDYSLNVFLISVWKSFYFSPVGIF